MVEKNYIIGCVNYECIAHGVEITSTLSRLDLVKKLNSLFSPATIARSRQLLYRSIYKGDYDKVSVPTPLNNIIVFSSCKDGRFVRATHDHSISDTVSIFNVNSNEFIELLNIPELASAGIKITSISSLYADFDEMILGVQQ